MNELKKDTAYQSASTLRQLILRMDSLREPFIDLLTDVQDSVPWVYHHQAIINRDVRDLIERYDNLNRALGGELYSIEGLGKPKS